MAVTMKGTVSWHVALCVWLQFTVTLKEQAVILRV